jgi:HrpA-like RNA helicase
MKSMINSQLEVLRITPASKATIIQRTGRAGREMAGGQCFRLYRESDYEKLPQQTCPEIVRCDLATALLQLTAMGVIGSKNLIPSLSQFPFIDKPSDQAIKRAELVLKRIGAIDGHITQIGSRLAAFPLHPIYANIVLNAAEFNCVREALVLVSLLSVDNLWLKKGKGGTSTVGDHWNLVQIFKHLASLTSNEDRVSYAKSHGINPSAYSKAAKIENQISKIYKQQIGAIGDHSDSMVKFQRMLAKSLWINCAKLVTRKNANSLIAEYETLDKITCYIHPSSCLFGLKEPPQCVVYTEITQTTRNYMRAVTAIDGNWLIELVPNYFRATANP